MRAANEGASAAEREINRLVERLARQLAEEITGEKEPVERGTTAERTAPERLLLRPREAAEALGLGRSTIYMLLNSGVLPSVKIGSRAVRVPVQSLREYVLARLEEGRQS